MVVAEKTQNLRRLEAQRNEINAKGALATLAYGSSITSTTSQSVSCNTTVVSSVRALREELVLLQEPASYVGEVAKVMGKKKVLVKVC